LFAATVRYRHLIASYMVTHNPKTPYEHVREGK
jgi:hypothetical protein